MSEWMLRNDAGEVVAWEVKTTSGTEIHFATGERRPLEPHESVVCDWSGRFCAFQRLALPGRAARAEIIRTDRPMTPLLERPLYGLSILSKSETVFLCSRSPNFEMSCEILDFGGGLTHTRVGEVRVPKADAAEDLDPWSDSLLLSEGVSDHPPRNRWALIDVRSKEIRHLGVAKRWAFFLREDLVARALERAPAHQRSSWHETVPQPAL
jgi:hypothetical protein